MKLIGSIQIQNMVEISHDLALLDNTIGREFEIFMVKLFEKLGYDTTVTNRSKDYGCDMMLQQGKYRIAVQAKRSESELNFTSVQRVLGSLKKYNAQMSIVVTKFSSFTNNMMEYNDLDMNMSRLLKMVKYHKNQQQENQLFIIRSIAEILNGNSSELIDTLKACLLTKELDTDIRMKIVTILLYTDLSVLAANPDYTYFDEIDFSIIKEIPTLLPKFNLLDWLDS